MTTNPKIPASRTRSIAARRKYYFPWRNNNQFRLLIDGDTFLPIMREAIEAAQAYVLMEMYLFESGLIADEFIMVLTQAVSRGIKVCLLLDDLGSRGLNRRDRMRLTGGGVNLIFYNPLRYTQWRRNLFRDHRKLLLVDGRVAFVGGTGITDEFGFATAGRPMWRETMVEIKGEVLQDWQDLFSRLWNRCSAEHLQVLWPGAECSSGTQCGRVSLSQSISHLEIKRSFLKRIRTAERHIWVTTAYFVPSRKIRRALRTAARNGLDVRLLLPGPIGDHATIRHASKHFYSRLLRDGVRIFEYQPRFMHAKVLLCDHWVSIGSSNLDRWSMYWNLEANQEIEDQRFAGQVGRMFEQDFAESVEVKYGQWHSRPLHRVFIPWFWGRIGLWLERFGK